MIKSTKFEKIPIAHLGLVVTNLEESSNFYCQFLGFEEQNRFETKNLTIVYLANGPLVLELLKYQLDPINERRTGRFDHLAFTVTDIDQSVQQLKSYGIQFLFDEPKQVFGDKTIVFLLGPDDEKIELVQASFNQSQSLKS